ncbi:MAG: chloride channel protein [Hyphomonadaceae bacterium]
MSLKRKLRRTTVWWRRYSTRWTAEQIGVMRRRTATLVGAILLGLAALGFAWLSDGAQALFATITRAWSYAPLVMTPAIFATGIWVTNRFARETRGSGIPQVIAACRAPDSPEMRPLVSVRTAISKLGLTCFLLLGGGSFGREGPTVQISAAIMTATHRLFRVPMTPGVLIAGGAAGVAAAFNTPLAGVTFAIEELAAAYEQRVAILAMGAVMIAGLVSLGIAGDYVYFGAMKDTLDLPMALLIASVVGVVGGLLGGLFTRIVLALTGSNPPAWAKPFRARPVLSAAGCGLVVAVLGVVTAGATFGTGYEASRNLIEGEGQAPWFAPAKFLATLASNVSGNPGGVFAPSLSVGAGIGDLLAPLFPGYSVGAIVVLGMVAYFAGVVRAPFTAIIIVSEATGSHGLILPLFISALLGDSASKLVCRTRLYHGLSLAFDRSRMAKRDAPPSDDQSGSGDAGSGDAGPDGAGPAGAGPAGADKPAG